MDRAKLRALVFEKTGIRIDEQDPVFALVALNDALLEEAFVRHAASLSEAGDRIKAQTRYLMEAGERYRKLHTSEPLSAQNTAAYEHWAKDNSVAPAQPAPAALPSGNGRLYACVGVAALLSALLVSAAQWVLPMPKPAPSVAPAAQVVPVPPMTPAQAELIRTGEKFSRAMLNLDDETRARVQAEMDRS